MQKAKAPENIIISPAEKAKKQLADRISKQQVKRFYRTARNLNSGENKNLGTALRSISTTEHEFKRAFSANQRLFKINRRRNIGSVAHIQVDDEIKNLNHQRRQSMTLSKLNISKNIEEVTKGAPMSVVGYALPKTATTALHDGVPTLLSRPHITRRIRTAPIHGRSETRHPHRSADVELYDPLRLLERIETSNGFSEMRDRIANRRPSLSATIKRPSRDIPGYLALDPLEEDSMRANMKKQAIDRWKQLHAGSDERCNELVKQWVQKNKQ